MRRISNPSGDYLQEGVNFRPLAGPVLSGAEGGSEGGRLSGYGWSEDISCFDASLYTSDWHPALSGFDRATLNVHVNGYFTDVPTGTQVLLSRRANGMPTASLYLHTVTLYADGTPIRALFISSLFIAP